jgi:hypothetical protein
VIENVRATNGSCVIRFDGRLLSSAVDPQSEARAWAKRRAVMLNRVKSIFILGAGSGYHIAELFLQTGAQLIVIERHADLVDAAKAIHHFESSRVRFENVESGRALRASDVVRDAVKGSFLVLQHAPCVALADDFYRDCENQLLGREWGSLNWQWQLKGFASLDAQPKIHASEEALSIYDLEHTELVQDSTERERMLVKALRELVK